MVEHTPTNEPNTDEQTRATTLGVLPRSIATILLAFVTIGVVSIGTALSYPVHYLIILIGAGSTAAIGIRTANADDRLHVTIGLTLLWGAALVFASTMTLIVALIPGVVIPTVVAVAAALGPFSIIGNTIQSYGHGASERVIGQYFTGTVIISVVIGILLGVSTFDVSIGETGMELIAQAIGEMNGTGRWVYVIVGIIIYTAFIYTVQKATHTLPIETLVTPRDFDRLEYARNTIDKAHYYARFVIGGFTLLSLATFAQIQQSGENTATEIAVILIDVTVHPVLLILFTSIGMIGIAAIAAVNITRKLSTITALDIIKTLTPPIIILTIAIIGTVVFASQITETMLTVLPTTMMENGTIYSELLTSHPPLIALLVLPIGLLCSAFLFIIPTIIAGLGTGDESLAGVASATLSLATLVIVAVLTHQSFLIIIGGVILTASVWEIGEYSTVAIGEIQSPSESTQLPNGFTSLTAVHIAATIIVIVIGVVFATVATIFFAGITITETTAVLTLILCSIALATVFIILSG